MLAFTWPIELTHFSGLTALLLFAALAVPVLLLARRSMSGLGAARQWTAVTVRLLVLLLLILILGGITWTRVATDVHVIVLRDASQSTTLMRNYPGPSLEESVNDFLRAATKTGDETDKLPADRVGVISFAQQATVDSVADTQLHVDARAIRDRGNGTDVAAAMQLGLATLQKDAMHRMVLIWDGNQTTGDLEAALNAAVAAHVPVDVMPLDYDVKHEVMVSNFIAPTWKRENEPFTLEVQLESTNTQPVAGKLTVTHQGTPMDLDPTTPGIQPTRNVTLQPGRNVERVQVPPIADAGVHQFRAVFAADEPDKQSAVTVNGQKQNSTDTLAANNAATAFTFVRGKGQVLYIDNTEGGGGAYLRDALARQGIQTDVTRTRTDQFPNSAVELQNYDAVILANVPRGPGGISDEQGQALAAYVHDLGGGLVDIGGPDAFGAGGWQGTRLEQVLPVDMDVPAQRQIPKGALALVMHSCEFPNGNYWGVQCGLKAVEVLNARDEIGVISYGWQGGGSGWDFPLGVKGDGSRVGAAMKNMQLGDMPDFDDSLRLALLGGKGANGLTQSDARNRHVIIISDGDPAPPKPDLIQACVTNKISISTVSVYPHDQSDQGLPPTMRQMAVQTGGRAYGPINANFSQLPQIFIKEATIVRRSLISENSDGIPVKKAANTSDVLKGIGDSLPGNVYGMVLSTRKNSPQVEVPLVAGKQNDPLLAHWQTGLGRALVFTSDAYNKWARDWVASDVYDKFWAQVVREVGRPAESADFDVRVTNAGGRGKIVVEAVNKENGFRNGLTIRGTVVGPDMQPHEVRLTQTAPGTYESDFDANDPGNYVVGMSYGGAADGSGGAQSGILRSGTVVNASPELRDLKSDDAILHQIADRTGGRYLDPFDAATAKLFDRAGLAPQIAPMPVWDLLLPFLIALLLIDVAVRRIAWDWESIQRMRAGVSGYIRGFTTPRKVETTQSLDALRRIRERGGDAPAGKPPALRPDPKAKFDPGTAAAQGDITKVVGGATGEPKKPKSQEPPKPQATGEGGTTGSLLEAKRRAQQKIREQEEGK